MWKYDPFCDFLSEVVKLPVVGEIILINNNIQATPNHVALEDPKITIVNVPKNIYVNPAWNLGVTLSKFDKLCFLSDDVIVDLNAFTKADEFLTEDMGVIGICQGHQEFGQPPVTDGSINIVEGKGINPFGLGSLFFIHKNNWIEIPEEFRIWFGDEYVYRKQTKTNYRIINCNYHSPCSVTLSSLTSSKKIIDEEIRLWKERKYFKTDWWTDY